MPGRFLRRRRRLYPRPFQGSGSPFGRLLNSQQFDETLPPPGGLAVACRTIEDAGGGTADESVHLYKCSIQFNCSIWFNIVPTEQQLGASLMAYPVSLVRRVPAVSPPALIASEVQNSPDAIIGHPFPVNLRSGGVGSIVIRRPIHLMNNAPGGYEAIWEGGLIFTGVNDNSLATGTIEILMTARYYQRFAYPGRSSG